MLQPHDVACASNDPSRSYPLRTGTRAPWVTLYMTMLPTRSACSLVGLVANMAAVYRRPQSINTKAFLAVDLIWALRPKLVVDSCCADSTSRCLHSSSSPWKSWPSRLTAPRPNGTGFYPTRAHLLVLGFCRCCQALLHLFFAHHQVLYDDCRYQRDFKIPPSLGVSELSWCFHGSVSKVCAVTTLENPAQSVQYDPNSHAA